MQYRLVIFLTQHFRQRLRLLEPFSIYCRYIFQNKRTMFPPYMNDSMTQWIFSSQLIILSLILYSIHLCSIANQRSFVMSFLRMEMFLGTMTNINGGTTFLFYFLLPLLYCCCHKDLPGHGAIMMCLKMITLSFSNLLVLETS
jgi:hypothetical protein